MSGRAEDPTPEEIAERAAAIRAEWTDEQLQRRMRVDYQQGRVQCRPLRMQKQNRRLSDDE
jgi:hypothetical protein